MDKKHVLKGGEFMTYQSKASEVFTPEDFDEEQLMIAQTCDDFLETEIFPNVEKIDAQEEGAMTIALEKAGELGLLGISVPEEYEGFGQSFVTSMLAADHLGAGYSFAVAFSAHTGIGTLPLLYYGNEEQKQRYLPALASGELKAAYCLTEPEAGSDANSGRTKAVLSEDGKHYIINGQKMWITNGGFADLLTVFAKIDNDRVLSAFLIESKTEGVTFNPEEKKMGIKGSSTRQIFFNDVKVPVENMLGKRGIGFRIALNILHLGRIKLGANVLGSCRRAITQSVVYANERKQFGQLISNFGAIKHKLGEQAIKTFAAESAVYRASKLIDDRIEAEIAAGKSKSDAILVALGEYATEAAILKVYASETLDYIVDEAVQIHGGMGYSMETPVVRAYLDSRINRIFEGTNEINRMVAVDTIMKKAMKKDISLFEEAEKILEEIQQIDEVEIEGDYYFDKLYCIGDFKKASMMLMGKAYKEMKKNLFNEQEIMINFSDMLAQIFVLESAVLRTQKMDEADKDVTYYTEMIDVLTYETAFKIQKLGMDSINSFIDPESEDYEDLLEALQFYTAIAPVNIKEARRIIADKMIEENNYCF